MPICVVVADSSRARILIAQSVSDPLVEHSGLVHPESRLKTQDLVSDGSGSESDAGGQGRHSMGHEKSAQQKQADDFAHELCRAIEKLKQKTRLHRIYLVASPKFLGLMRGCISKQCASLVAGEINKDLVQHSIDEIRAHLPRQL